MLDDHEGVATRAQLMAAAPHHLIDRAVSSGQLVRIFPRTYVASDRCADAELLARAALAYAGLDAALSHLSGLLQWALPAPSALPVHILTGRYRQLRGGPGLAVHRRAGFANEPPFAVVRNGLATVRLDQCLVDSWPLLHGDDQRAPLILAVQRRLTTPERILVPALALPNLRGQADLLRLLHLLREGCRSELEIWGYLRVFRHESLPAAQRQLRLALGSRTVHLDIAYADVKLDVELDGAAYHGNRERDLARDIALASHGWQTLRFTHRRLHAEPHLVRREVAAVIAARRAPLRGA